MTIPTAARFQVLIVQNADRTAGEADALFTNTPVGLREAEQDAQRRSQNGSTQEVVLRWVEESFKVARRFVDGSKVPPG
jgi:hypothetical protein